MREGGLTVPLGPGLSSVCLSVCLSISPYLYIYLPVWKPAGCVHMYVCSYVRTAVIPPTHSFIALTHQHGSNQYRRHHHLQHQHHHYHHHHSVTTSIQCTVTHPLIHFLIRGSRSACGHYPGWHSAPESTYLPTYSTTYLTPFTIL